MKSCRQTTFLLRPVAGAIAFLLLLGLAGAVAAPAPSSRGDAATAPATAAAGPDVQPVGPARSDGRDAVAPLPFPDRPDAELSPLMRDIKAAWLEHLAALADLEARRDAATDEEAYLEAQRAIEQLQMGLERTFLVIQIDHARRDGREADLARLEAALERHDSPPDLRAKVERPLRDADRR